MTGSSVNSASNSTGQVKSLPHAESPQWLAFVEAKQTAVRVPGVPDWWVQGAAEARERILRSGFPTTKREDWKYTSLMPLHGKARRLSMGPVDVRGPRGLQVFTLSQLSKAIASGDASGGTPWGSHEEMRALETRLREAFSRRDLGFGAELCRAFVDDPFIVRIPKGFNAAEPVEIHWKSLPKDQWSFGLAYVDVGEGANAVLSESYGRGVDAQSVQTVLHLESSAKVSHLRTQRGEGGVVIASTLARLKSQATYHAVQVASGSGLAREDFYVELLEKHASAIADGVFVGKSKDVSDHHTNLIHLVGDTQSQQLYKGILADESRGVFNGRVVIAKGASGANSAQLNKNLLLSKKVEIDTKPELEIENDDVKAAHGAAIGRLDKEHLFYLRSRGITQAQAVEVLARGFAFEVVDKLESDSLRALGREAVNEALVGLRWEDT